MQPACISEQMMFNTLRLEAGDSCGTGFFFNFAVNGGVCPTIVTNKHVINNDQDAETTFLVHLDNGDGSASDNYRVTHKTHWFFHPTHDLCFCLAGPVFNAVKQATKKNVFYIPNDESIIATEDKLNELRALEEVTMVGYPIGLWDEVNNFPIFRHGYTASHPAFDFNEPSIGLVDMACYPGSSGSPIYILEEGGYRDKNGTTHMGVSRLIFLGVLFAGPQYTATGSLEIVNVPTQMMLEPRTSIMTNLGYYVRARELMEFQGIVDFVVSRGF